MVCDAARFIEPPAGGVVGAAFEARPGDAAPPSVAAGNNHSKICSHESACSTLPGVNGLSVRLTPVPAIGANWHLHNGHNVITCRQINTKVLGLIVEGCKETIQAPAFIHIPQLVNALLALKFGLRTLSRWIRCYHSHTGPR